MLGKIIVDLRISRGLSQSQLAKRLKITCRTVKNWESDTADPSAENIINLAALFAVSSDHILGIKKNNALILDSLPVADQKKLRAIFQAYVSELEDEQ